MTAEPLTVYGKRIGSLWDSRIGGRWELTEITDTGGSGMWVTLRRVHGGHELAVSVYNLGRNYVCVPDKAEPVGAVRHVEHPSETVIAAKARVKEAVDAEKKARADAALIRPPIAASADVPLAAWEVEHLNRERPIEQFDGVDFGDLIRIGGAALYRVVDADGKPILEPAPAPTPPLPWIEHPAAWWRDLTDHFELIYPSGQMDTADTPADWQRVAVIPWDLIDQLRVVVPGDDDNGLNEAADAILDAADGVTS